MIFVTPPPNNSKLILTILMKPTMRSGLTQILRDVADIIGAQILNIAHQDYDPQGASVTMLISEGDVLPPGFMNSQTPGPLPDTVLAHLDKSHITVHTYPESHPDNGISTFRADIVRIHLRPDFAVEGVELPDPQL